MKTLKPVYVAGGILLLALQGFSVQAEQVQMYDKPVSAEEMGRILFGKQPKKTVPEAPAMKMRSIGFKPKVADKSSDMEIAQNAEEERTSIGLPIKFAYNSADILDESKPFLDEVGKMLSMEGFTDKRLIIEGHTDAAGSEHYNMILSQSRARAVSAYLTSTYGISNSRLITKGLGESKPLPGKNPFDGANRRVQFYSAD
ncbi:MAG: OmpA family protein [Gammaproteobacteria bacterium]